MLATLKALLNLAIFYLTAQRIYHWAKTRYSKTARVQRASLKVYQNIIKFPMSKFIWDAPAITPYVDGEREVLRLLLAGPAKATVFDADGNELYTSNLELHFPVPVSFKGWDPELASYGTQKLVDDLTAATVQSAELSIHGNKLQLLHLDTGVGQGITVDWFGTI